MCVEILDFSLDVDLKETEIEEELFGSYAEDLVDNLIDSWYYDSRTSCIIPARQLQHVILGGMSPEELTNLIEGGIVRQGFTDPEETAKSVIEFLFDTLSLKVETGISENDLLGFYAEIILRDN